MCVYYCRTYSKLSKAVREEEDDDGGRVLWDMTSRGLFGRWTVERGDSRCGPKGGNRTAGTGRVVRGLPVTVPPGSRYPLVKHVRRHRRQCRHATHGNTVQGRGGARTRACESGP